MCGIIFTDQVVQEDDFKNKVMNLSHRGPDSFKIVSNNETGKELTFGQTLLSFRNMEEGKDMPYEFTAQNGVKWYLGSNAEIYNQALIRNDVRYHWYTYKTQENDGEVIFPVMCSHGFNGPRELDGQFAFVLTNGKTHYIARDPYGITSLYYGYDENNKIWVSSELKCIHNEVVEVRHVPPGYVLHNQSGEFQMYNYNTNPWMNRYMNYTPKTEVVYELLRKSVRKRLQSDSEVALFLSGGLDSSLVGAIAQSLTSYKMKSFSVGFSADSPDLVKARQVAEHIGTDHYELIVSVDDAIKALPDVISAIETFDVTTVRASVPMYLLAKYMHSKGVRCALSGEGSDEIFGGYLYFHNTNHPFHFHKECVRLLENLHMFDCLRAHKSGLASSVEVRVPFLDKGFVNYIMNMDPSFKMIQKGGIEKNILRSSVPDGLLPYDVVWRQKEQFSDGVGYCWIDSLYQYTTEYNVVKDTIRNDPALTPEQKCFMDLFYKRYSDSVPHSITQVWVPKWSNTYDPSGRAQNVHNAVH